MGAPRGAPVKYHYFHRFFTYSMVRERASRPTFWRCKAARSCARPTRVEDSVRWGVWLGRHICQMITQVS